MNQEIYENLAYYNLNAENFIENTQNVDMHLAQDRFLHLLNEGAAILDFGCEERTEGEQVMAVVTLMNPSGEELRVKAEDAMLYERNINDGDKVYFDEENNLDKIQ